MGPDLREVRGKGRGSARDVRVCSCGLVKEGFQEGDFQCATGSTANPMLGAPRPCHGWNRELPILTRIDPSVDGGVPPVSPQWCANGRRGTGPKRRVRAGQAPASFGVTSCTWRRRKTGSAASRFAATDNSMNALRMIPPENAGRYRSLVPLTHWQNWLSA